MLKQLFFTIALISASLSMASEEFLGTLNGYQKQSFKGIKAVQLGRMLGRIEVQACPEQKDQAIISYSNIPPSIASEFDIKFENGILSINFTKPYTLKNGRACFTTSASNESICSWKSTMGGGMGTQAEIGPSYYISNQPDPNDVDFSDYFILLNTPQTIDLSFNTVDIGAYTANGQYVVTGEMTGKIDAIINCSHLTIGKINNDTTTLESKNSGHITVCIETKNCTSTVNGGAINIMSGTIDKLKVTSYRTSTFNFQGTCGDVETTTEPGGTIVITKATGKVIKKGDVRKVCIGLKYLEEGRDLLPSIESVYLNHSF